MAYTLNIVSQPVATGTGRVTPVPYVIEVLNSGVRDTSFTGNVTAAKQTGSGTAGGTTTVACVSGVATFSALSMSSTGNHTIRFADATHSTTVDSATLDVVPAGSSLLDGYRTIAMRDPVYGTVQHFEVMISSGLNLANPVGIFVGSNPSGYYNSDAPGGVANGPARLRQNLGWFQYIDTVKATFPLLSVAFPIETGSEDDKRGYYEAVNVLPQYLAAIFGITPNDDVLHFTGYSTAGITAHFLVTKFPSRFAYLSTIDGMAISAVLTGSGTGITSYAPMPGYLNDPPGYLDVAYLAALAQLLVDSRSGMAFFHGTAPIGPGTGDWLEDGPPYEATNYLRDIRDPQPLIDNLKLLVPSDVAEISGSSTTSQLTAPTRKRFVYEHFNGSAHGHAAMATAMYNTTDGPKLLALHLANPRRSLPVLYTPPTPARVQPVRGLLF